MTIEEIIKGLRCCAKNDLDACKECPAMYDKCDQLYTKAADLLSAQQAGRLVVLPCKPGDTVYRLCGPKGRKHVGERLVTGVSLCGNNSWLILSTTEDWLGKTVFLSRQEAEAALEAQKGGDGHE